MRREQRGFFGLIEGMALLRWNALKGITRNQTATGRGSEVTWVTAPDVPTKASTDPLNKMGQHVDARRETKVDITKPIEQRIGQDIGITARANDRNHEGMWRGGADSITAPAFVYPESSQAQPTAIPDWQKPSPRTSATEAARTPVIKAGDSWKAPPPRRRPGSSPKF